MLGACALACLALRPAPVTEGRPHRPTTRATIEPTLPVDLEMQFVSTAEAARGGTTRLLVSIVASTKVADLSVDLRVPPGVRVADGTPPGWTMALEAGETRQYEVPLVADDSGAFPIRAEASFRLPDGRSFRVGQGATLRLGSPPPEVRENAGASEYMGVPLQEPVP